ncbi:MAG TPA: acetate kinase [Pseudogracilibacillus sp.]|nr:acetate kinase [Pseudogracilibacillus sp.]
MKKILAINAGSSSLKFQLFAMPEEVVLAKGLIERIGMTGSSFSLVSKSAEEKVTRNIKDHREAVDMLLKQLLSLKVIKGYNEIDAIGHRVAHGGEYFDDSALIDESVIEKIVEMSEFAPLHNPANLVGIQAFKEYLPDIPTVAVFDTAFHQTMPEKSFIYSMPYEYYTEYGIRKYGFHGTSHKYVAERAADLMDRPLDKIRIISCHLGNGVSITAINKGKSIDTTMGFTPLAGVTMGTRSGDIDPAIIPYVMRKTGLEAQEVIEVLNEKSGMLALSGISNDLRDIEAEVDTNPRAELALEVFAGQIHQYIGSYATKMAGVDAIVFTAGVGENSTTVRSKILNGLEFMGVYWDPLANQDLHDEGFITYPHSPVKVLVVPTDEEVMIARDTMRLAES